MEQPIIPITYYALASLIGILSCGVKSSSNAAVDRCDAVARKVSSLRGGDENTQAATYQDIVRSCTPGSNQELTEHGEALVLCLEQASNGAAVHRCELDAKDRLKAKSLEDLLTYYEEAFRILTCTDKTEEKEAEVYERLEELERSAIDAGYARDEIVDSVAEVSKRVEKAGCK